MRKLLLGSAALIAMSVASMGGPAVAADMPVKARPLPPVYTWTRCYLGAFVGYETGRAKERTLAGVDFASYHLSGFNGGFDGGCNYQFGAWVIGIEVDGAATNKDGQSLTPSFTFITQTNERWLATARGRIGYAWDKTLFYVTGGGAWAGVEATAFLSTQPITALHHKRTLSGWTVGAGWEYALGYGWWIKSEFLYVNFGWKSFFDPPDTPVCIGCTAPRDIYHNNYIYKVGMNYKFDWGKAPVIAKY